MKRWLLLASLLSSSAYALDYCEISKDDPQMRNCVYSPAQRYVVNSPVGYPVNLKFGDEERIKRTEFAFTGQDKDGRPSPTWRGPAVKSEGASLPENKFRNNLPIWAFQEGHSALLVITSVNDTERSYTFDLTATVDTMPNTTSSLTFTYPVQVAEAAKRAADEKKQAAAATWREQRAKATEADAVARLKVDVLYGVRNWAYQVKADQKYKFLQPREVSDNGWLTEFQWPGNVQPPTITILDPATGDERITAVSQIGDMYVVPTTAEWFRLRLGHDAVMDVHNLHWSPERPDPKSGTTSPDVIRTVVFQDKK